MKQTRLLLLAPLLLAACGDNENPNRVVGELASDRIELTAETAEPIVEIAVAEGDEVTQGQLLLRQDARRALVRLEELEFREAEFERARQVHARGLASPELLDQADAALDAAKSNLDLRRAQLSELLTGTTVEEIAQAEQAVKQAAALRDAARIDLERHDILAPVDGIADSRLFEIGERPVPGQTVMVRRRGSTLTAWTMHSKAACAGFPAKLRSRPTSPLPSTIVVALALPQRWISSRTGLVCRTACRYRSTSSSSDERTGD